MYSKQNLIVSMGEIINLTTGEYSDFGYVGNFVFIKKCDLALLAQEYCKEKNKWDADMNAFGTWLVSQQYCVPVDNRDIHLGEYSEFSPEFNVIYKED